MTLRIEMKTNSTIGIAVENRTVTLSCGLNQSLWNSSDRRIS